MAIAEGRMSARFLLWFPLACFIALLATMPTVYILAPGHHLAFAIVEWVELLVGTVSAVIAFVAVFLSPRIASPVAGGWSRPKGLSVSSFGIVVIFCVFVFLCCHCMCAR